MLDLRPYQVDALEAIDEAAGRGIQRPLVVHPTGSGKTVEFAHLLARRGGGIVLVHRDELVSQTFGKLRIVAPELSIGVVKAERNECRADVVLASVQTVQNMGRLAEVLGQHGDFHTVIVDEAHHAPAASWTNVLTGLGSFTPGGPLTAGFTATQERSDGALGVWQEIVAYKTIREMVYEGYLCDIIGERLDTTADLNAVRSSVSGDLNAASLGAELSRSGAIGQIAIAVKAHAADRKTVAFTPTVATAQQLAVAVSALGIPAEALWGAMPYEDRRLVLKRLHTGETRFVANCAVLTEGFDEPSVDCILIARPTSSHGLYVQMVGRGTRIYPGKANCLILDVVGVTERHDLIGVINLGLAYTPTGSAVGPDGTGGVPISDPCELCGRQLSKELISDGKTRHRNCRAGGTARAQMFAASRMRWLEVDTGFCIPTQKGAMVIVPTAGDDDLWQLIDYANAKLTVLQKAVPIDWAQGIGEDRAKAFGKLAKRTASWLKMRPSQAQLTRLQNEGLPEHLLSRVKTKGEAADLITRLQGRRAIRRLERQG